MAVAYMKESQIEVRRTLVDLPEIPPLENGDILTREEFERRYNAMPHLKKAELIEGRVYMSSAVKISHSESHAKIITWLGMYWVATPGLNLNDNGTIRLDEKNEPQPDASLRIESGTMGRSRVSADDYVEGPPEIIVEIAGSSASYDLHEKLEAYRRNGVQEYVVWQIYENRLDWFQLVEGKYVPLPSDADGIIHSRVFPGLHLAMESLLAGDMAEVLAILQTGLQTKEHAAFVQYLKGEKR
jgi:Uma2 family endonuclease